MSRTFEPHPMSVPEARAFVGEALASVGVTSVEVAEAARLSISELTTNAVLHAATRFDVVVEVGRNVRLSVIDGDPRPPRRRTPDGERPGGRGLAIVDAFTTDWGYEPAGDGKRVWCVIPLDDR